MVGLNHRTARLEIRERVAVEGQRLPETLRSLKAAEALDEVAVLSTCNRSEVYAVVGGPSLSDPGRLLAALSRPGPDSPPDFGPHLYKLEGLEAAAHLFRVAAGLDSLVLGESEVLGQVKAAYEAARRAGTAGPVLHALFQGALRAGSRARTETAIAASAVSVPYVSLSLARKVFDELAGKAALLIGTGDIGRVALRHLVEAGLGEIVAANRTLERAVSALAALGPEEDGERSRVRRRAVTLDRIPEVLGGVDVVLACSEAPDYVVRPEDIQAALRARRGRPLLLIDLGVPRQIDPALARREGVYLFDLDDLEAVVAANVEERRREALQVERIVQEEVERFDAWRRGRRAVPLIRRLRESAEAIRAEELGKVLDHLETATPRERELVAEFSRRLTRRLLDYPTVTLRELAVQPDGTPVADFIGRVLDGRAVRRRSQGPGPSGGGGS